MRCEGCHNPDTWSRDGGTEVPVDEIISDMLSNPLTDGLTLSGGEPFLQVADCVKLASAARGSGLNVWVYTGYTFEELLARSESEEAANLPRNKTVGQAQGIVSENTLQKCGELNPKKIKELINLTDILIDGPFVLAERTLSQKWRGSRNQRVLDVSKSIAAGKAVEIV